MFRRPSAAKAAAGKNLSPASWKSTPKKANPVGPPHDEPALSVMRPRPWAMVSSSAQTTTNACPPSSEGLGSPARLGKLLQRNAVPPAFSAHALSGSPISLMFVMTVSLGCTQEAPPSVDSSSLSCRGEVSQLHHAAIASPLASNAGLVPLPHRLAMLMLSEPPVQLAPPLSEKASKKFWPDGPRSVHVTSTRPKCGLEGFWSTVIASLSMTSVELELASVVSWPQFRPSAEVSTPTRPGATAAPPGPRVNSRNA